MNNDKPRNEKPERLEDLVSRCALRDEPAFVALYEATSAKLFAVVLRILRTRHWAEEVLQETYMNVWRYAGNYNAGRGAPMTWLINIARNQALDFLRRSEFRGQKGERVPEEELRADDDPQQDAQMSAELARLRGCLEGLGEQQRRCLLLVHHEGYSPVEVAEQQKLPLGTVKTWIRRGLMRLRECLGA